MAITQSPENDALISAAVAGDIPAARAALAQGAEMECRNSHYETPLITAARCGHEELGLWLIKEGANVQAQASGAKTNALMYASKKCPELSRVLVEAGVDPSYTNKDKVNVPLHNAIRAGYEDLLDVMLEKGARTNVFDMYREAPLDTAALHGSRRAFDALLAAGANPCLIDHWGEPLLHKPCMLGFRELTPEKRESAVLALLSAGADTGKVGRKGDDLQGVVMVQRPHMRPMVERILRAPQPSDAAYAAATRESLLQGDGSLLDNPKTWRFASPLLEAMAQKGEPLSRTDLQNHTAPDGNDYLLYGLRCVGFNTLQAQLQPHGLGLTHKDLLTHEGKASPLLEEIIAQKDVRSIFSRAMWKDAPVEDIRRTAAALPDEVRAQVPLYSLIQWKHSQNPQTAKGR